MNRDEFIKVQKEVNQENVDRLLKGVKEKSGLTLYELIDNIIEEHSTYVDLKEPFSISTLWYGTTITKEVYKSCLDYDINKLKSFSRHYNQGYKPEFEEVEKEVKYWKWFKRVKKIKKTEQIKRYVKKVSSQPTISIDSFTGALYVIIDYIDELGFTCKTEQQHNHSELHIFWLNSQ